jgi:hypothetical protein
MKRPLVALMVAGLAWMRNVPLMRPIVPAVALAAVAAAGVAYAAIPSSGGVVTACYAKAGDLRVIDAEAGAQCKSGETPLSWDQQGPAGPVGPAGPPGTPGASGITGYEIVVESVEIGGAQSGGIFVDCPAGKKALSGGFFAPAVNVTQSRPVFGGTAWHVSGQNLSTVALDLEATVVCAFVT